MRGRRRGPPYPRVPFAGDSDAGCRSVGFVSGAARLRRNNLSGHRARGHFSLRSEPIDADQAWLDTYRMLTMHIGLTKHARDCSKTTLQKNDVSGVGAQENSTIWTIQIVGVVVCPASHCRTLESSGTGLCQSRSLGRRRIHDHWRLCCRVTGRRAHLSRRKV
jgi:hypothetical protein